MDEKTIRTINEFSETVIREFPIKKIVLYGSYAKGNESEFSDIDIAVIVDRFEGDILKANSRLFTLVRNIDPRIEPVLLETEYDKSRFVENIIKTGKVIYSIN